MSAISESIEFLTKNSVKTIVSRIRERNVPGLIQFALYSVCGTIATVFFLGTVLVLSKTVFPAYPDLVVAKEPFKFLGFTLFWAASTLGDHGITIGNDAISDGIRAQNLTVNSTIAFFLANTVAYVTNILLVFKQGRYHPVVEFFYFMFVSAIAFTISLFAGPWLIKVFGLPTNVAILTNMVTSMLLNFAGRKIFVFKS
jgi:putative flippase GtrA